jgi:threonine dehydratase
MAMTSPSVSADDVASARDVLREILPPTPLLHSRVLSERLGGPVFLKCENLQRTGSFKARGGYLRISRLSEEERARGVVAASAGNHAQGVAFAAALLGVKATVIMPEGAPLPKMEATRGYGADIILHGETVDDALDYAREYVAERGAVLIHPFDHPDIVAGQGTLGLEILEQCPQVRTIAIPVGGGGLAAGVTVAVKSADPSIAVIGVQAEAVAAYPASLAAGQPVRVAAAVAGLMEFSGMFEPPVVAVLSGGNIDPLLLAKVLRHGLAAAGRYLTFRCRIPDRPGALAGLLGAVAGLGANVLDVMHERVTPRLRVDEVEVLLQVETRGPAHCDDVISELRQAGYHLMFR